MSIQSYDYKPTPRFLRANALDNDVTLGWELEVEAKDSGISPRHMARDITPEDGYCYFKSDGSINNGFEIVSHPMTEKWIKKNKKRINGMLDKLTNADYRSYKTSTCGMHVHIGKDGFSTWHLYRFMKFFYENQKFILLISQRKEEKLKQWSALEDFNRTRVLHYAKKKMGGGNRYVAINLTRHTAEVRIFRGTLNVRSFHKNLEFVLSTYEYTRDHNADAIMPVQYLAWVKTNKQRFANLDGWLADHTEQLKNLCNLTY